MSIPHQLINHHEHDNGIHLNSSALLTFESIDSFHNFNKKFILSNRFPKDFYFIIYSRIASSQEIQSALTDFNEIQDRNPGKDYHFGYNHGLTDILQNQYFIVNEGNSIKLLTFIYYSSEQCGKPKLVEVNRFNKTSRTWNGLNFEIRKFENFHGCTLNTYWDSSFSFYGFYDVLMIIEHDLASYLNYSSYEYPRMHEQFFTDIRIMTGCLNEYQDNFFIVGPTLFSIVNMAAPPAENFSEFEKLLLPFDEEVWILIGFTFIVAFAIVFATYFVRQSTRNFIFGTRVRTPSLNIASIFFGISMNVLPRRNFARFILTMFAIYSLIIRTTWQGKMFEFLKKNVSKPEIQTIDEMIEKNFMFYLLPEFEKIYPDSDLVKR